VKPFQILIDNKKQGFQSFFYNRRYFLNFRRTNKCTSERIRDLRNELAHNSELEICDTDFSTHWTDLSQVK
jgi:hypothetical protein